MKEAPARSSGENWTYEEEEKLVALWNELVLKMEGRSSAAVVTRLERLSQCRRLGRYRNQ